MGAIGTQRETGRGDQIAGDSIIVIAYIVGAVQIVGDRIIVMAYIVMADIVRAYIVVAYMLRHM